MRTLTLPDDKLQEVLEALEQSRSSEHNPRCEFFKAGDCSCHVAKAKSAYDIMRSAAQRVIVRAGDLKVGQLLVAATATVSIVSVQKGPGILPKVSVRIEHADGKPETLDLPVDQQVTIIDLAA